MPTLRDTRRSARGMCDVVLGRLSFRHVIHHRGGEFRQRFVGLLFLGKRLVKQSDRVAQAELLRPGAQGAIAGDLVVLDRLGGGEQPGIMCRRVLALAAATMRG